MKRYNATNGVIERTDGFWVSYDAVQKEIERLQKRVAELEDAYVKSDETIQIWIHKYRERGERMKEMQDALQKVIDDSEIGVVPRSHLDRIERLLETGEPL